MVLLSEQPLAEAKLRPAITIDGVDKTFGVGAAAFTAVSDVTLQIYPNEFFTLLGPSGCGKTTLLRMLAGFEAPTAGRILLGEADITDLPPYRRPVNTVFQSYALFPHMSVEQNVAFGLRMQGRARAEVLARVDAMLDLVRLAPLRSRRTDQLSGGQQQRVALARALAPRPQVLLLDEPFSALDYKLRKEMQTEIKRMQHETGITFVFVTHDQEEALAMSDRIAVMSAGRVLQTATPGVVYNRPANRFVAGFIGDANVLPGRVLSCEGGQVRARLDAGGMVRAVADPGSVVGKTIEVMIRPEACSLTPLPSQELDNHLAGALASATYLGSDTLYTVTLGSTVLRLRTRTTLSNALQPAIGDRVGIRIAPGAATVVAP